MHTHGSILLKILFPYRLLQSVHWTKKKAEYQRIDAFELWCYRRFFRVPWTARRTKLSILKKINPEYTWEGLMLMLKLQYLATWCKEPTQRKKPTLGKIKGRRRRGRQRMRWLDSMNGHKFEQTPGDSKGQGSLACCSPWGCKESDMTLQVNNNGWFPCYKAETNTTL